MGLKITCNIFAGKMFLSQAPYVEKILERFGMQQAKGVNTPMVKQNSLVHADKEYQADNSMITWYQQAVCSLMYAMTETQFDIAYVVSTVSQFASNPTSENVAAVKRIFLVLELPSVKIGLLNWKGMLTLIGLWIQTLADQQPDTYLCLQGV